MYENVGLLLISSILDVERQSEFETMKKERKERKGRE
jgi:hypothetical protein